MKETIMKEEKTTMMKQLVEQLNNASQAYYNGEAELMSDYEWDSKFDQLKLLEDETGIVLPDSVSTLSFVAFLMIEQALACAY